MIVEVDDTPFRETGRGVPGDVLIDQSRCLTSRDAVPVILEHAILPVHPDDETDFEAAIPEADPLAETAPSISTVEVAELETSLACRANPGESSNPSERALFASILKEDVCSHLSSGPAAY